MGNHGRGPLARRKAPTLRKVRRNPIRPRVRAKARTADSLVTTHTFSPPTLTLSSGRIVHPYRPSRRGSLHSRAAELFRLRFQGDSQEINRRFRDGACGEAMMADRGNWVAPSVVGFVTSQSDSRGCRASSLSSTWTLITRLAPAARLGGKVTAAAPCGASIPNAANTPRTWGQDG